MTVICTGDLHFTTNPHDEYRWGITEWLCDHSKGVDEVILLGDYTGPKDSHPGLLVNRFKESIDKLHSHFSGVYILYGNHDGLTPETAFWKFLNGMQDNVYFIDRPSYAELSIGKVLFLPAGVDWNTINNNGIIKYIFTHATFEGAISETGFHLSGVPLEHANRIGVPIISGDIHKPQIIGEFIEYVGAPYHIRFGDQYEPRVMQIDNKATRNNLYYPAPQKKVYNIHTLEDFEKLPIDDKQHAKIRVHLDRGGLTEWPIIKDRITALAESAGWTNIRPELVLKPEVSSTEHRSQNIKSPEQLVSEYAERHNAGERHIEVGRSLL